jgi:hypothetical protein
MLVQQFILDPPGKKEGERERKEGEGRKKRKGKKETICDVKALSSLQHNAYFPWRRKTPLCISW